MSELNNYSPYIYTNLTEKYKDTIQYIYRDHLYKEQMLKLRYDAIEIAVKNIANIPITQKEQDYIKSYPWEVKIGKQAYTKLEPMFKNIIPKLKKAKTLTKQIEIILEHTKNVFKIQAELQKNLKNNSVHIFQLGFYKANSILNKNTFKDNIFVFEYYDNSVFLTVNEFNYKESELYRQITDIEREKFNIKLRRTPNMAVHFLLYLIPHKQRWQFF